MALHSPRISATSSMSRNHELLGQPQLPIAGIIRAGIQAMTQEGAKVPELRKIYEDGVAAGASFKDILKRGQEHPKCPQRNGRPLWWLRPTNVPYFTVRQTDFPGISGAADSIMDLYGEVRDGDPERRLYSFPVVFPTDVLDIVFKEEFSEFNSTGARVHWSQMSTDGVLKCVQYAQLKAEGKSARKQLFDARRQTEIRCDCEPDSCEFFGAGKCAHYGSLFFWIPGINSEGVIRLTFKSVYTKLAVYDTLTRIHDQVLGRISGLYRDSPIFRIGKRHQSLPRVNLAEGKTERSDQWIVHLSAPGVNVIEALSGRGEQDALAAPERDETPCMSAPDSDDDAPGDGNDNEDARLQDLEVSRLRKELNAARLKLGWPDDEFAAWAEHQNQGVALAVAMRDADRLTAMIDMLMHLDKPAEKELPL